MNGCLRTLILCMMSLGNSINSRVLHFFFFVVYSSLLAILNWTALKHTGTHRSTLPLLTVHPVPQQKNSLINVWNKQTKMTGAVYLCFESFWQAVPVQACPGPNYGDGSRFVLPYYTKHGGLIWFTEDPTTWWTSWTLRMSLVKLYLCEHSKRAALMACWHRGALFPPTQSQGYHKDW